MQARTRFDQPKPPPKEKKEIPLRLFREVNVGLIRDDETYDLPTLAAKNELTDLRAFRELLDENDIPYWKLGKNRYQISGRMWRLAVERLSQCPRSESDET